MKTPKSKFVAKKSASPVSAKRESVPCVIYARARTEDQVSQDQSLADQEHACLTEIQNKGTEGWFHAATKIDAGYSGATLARPGLRQLLAMIRRGKAKVVVVHKRDRLCRGLEMSAQLQSIFDQYSVRVLSCSEGLHDGNAAYTFMRRVIDAQAQLERRIIQGRLHERLRFAAKNGFWKGGRPSLGYKYQNGSKTLDIEVREARIVRQIFEQIANGVPVLTLALELRKMRLFGRKSTRSAPGPNPTQPRLISGVMIRGIIANPVYRGIVRVKKQVDQPTSGRSGDNWEEFRGRHAPLVSDEIWFRANQGINTPRE